MVESINKKIETTQSNIKNDPTLGNNSSILNLPLPNGNYFDSAQLNLWSMHLKNSCTINAGVYRSGTSGIAATPYAAIQYDFLSGDHHYFKYALNSSFAIFSILPDSYFGDRYVLGVVPSIQTFFASEQKLFGGIIIREAIEAELAIPFGVNYEDFFFPVAAGISFGKMFTPEHSLVTGAKIVFVLDVQDIQDTYSIFPNFNNANIFISGKTPIVDFGLGVEIYNDETDIKAVLSKSFPFLGGLLTFALAGQAPVSGDFPMYAPYISAKIGYNVNTADKKKGLSAQYIADAPFKKFKTDKKDIMSTTDLQILKGILNIIYGYEKSGDAIVGTKEQCTYTPKSGIFTCYNQDDVLVGKLTCEGQVGSNLVCYNDNSEFLPLELDFKVAYELEYESDVPGYGNSFIYTITKAPYIESEDPAIKTIYNAILNSKDLETFSKTVDASLNEDEKIKALNFMADVIYDTYNSADLFSDDDDKINNISLNEMYVGAKDTLFDNNNAKKTSVCRGFAKFIAHLADEWGFKTKIATFRSEKDWHVITIIKKSNDNFVVINGGLSAYETDAKSLTQTLEEYISTYKKAPPQLKFRIFDKDGKYEKTLFTSEGKMLLESTTAPSKLDEFIQF